MYIQGGVVLLFAEIVCVYFHSFANTFAFISNATESYHLALKSVLTKYSKILNLQCCCVAVSFYAFF